MHFRIKIIALFFSGLCLLTPSISQAQDLGPPPSGIDWNGLADGLSFLVEAGQATGTTINLGTMTPEEVDALKAQYMALNATKLNELIDELAGYANLWNQIQSQIQAGTAVDYDDIAQQLGLEPGIYTPDELLAMLQKLQYEYTDVNRGVEAARAAGITDGQYMRWLMGHAKDANGLSCASLPPVSAGDINNPSPEQFYGTDNVSCYNNIRNVINDALHAPPAQPTQPTQPTEPLVADHSSAGDTLLNNLRLQIPSLVRLVFALSYTIGVVFCIISIIKLKHIGESRGANSASTGGLFSVMAYMITGSMLIYLPSSLNVTTGTLFALGGDSSLFAYSNNAIAGMTFDNLIAVVVDIVKLVGLIAFVRGWIMLSKMGSQSSHGTMGKSMVHIIAGILAVNIVTTWEVARATFGYVW